MSINLLRWKSGAAGDTVLKLVLESNPNICSQVVYTKDINTARSVVDLDYVESFRYKEIAMMSTTYNKINKTDLLNELTQLHNEDTNRNWLLKTHAYIDFPYTVVDIVTDKFMLPFAVTACLKKNFQGEHIKSRHDPEYNKIIKLIKDPKILYKYHCYNLAVDRVSTQSVNTKKITLLDILSGWTTFLCSLDSVQLHVSSSVKNYYDNWLIKNSVFFPSQKYKNLVETENYDYSCTDLSLEERYCLLALAGGKFKIL
jgi:uncharacterized protein YceK